MSKDRETNRVEVNEGGERRSLAVSAVRLGRFASVSLTFEGRYRRGIQLTRAQLLAHREHCNDVLAQMPEDA